MGQAGRDGRDGRDVLAVLRRAWDRLVGMVGMVLLCSIMCGTGWSGRSGWCGYGCARGNLPKLESDPTIPISTTRFRFYHSDFDNTPSSSRQLFNVNSGLRMTD